MIGPKELSSIRQELRRALDAAGDDPILWLKQRMTAPAHPRAGAPEENEVLQSLRRWLEAPGGGKR
jgi:hypothetical protein